MSIRLTNGRAATPYVYQPFPKHVQHTDGRSCVVPDEAAWIALGPGWGYTTSEPDSPAIAEEKTAIAVKPRRKRVDAER